MPRLTHLVVSGGLAACLGLAACADVPPEPRWTRPGATDAERAEAIEACIAEAEAVATSGSEQRERRQVEVRGNAFLRCMNARGWTQVQGEGP